MKRTHSMVQKKQHEFYRSKFVKRLGGWVLCLEVHVRIWTEGPKPLPPFGNILCFSREKNERKNAFKICLILLRCQSQCAPLPLRFGVAPVSPSGSFLTSPAHHARRAFQGFCPNLKPSFQDNENQPIKELTSSALASDSS